MLSPASIRMVSIWSGGGGGDAGCGGAGGGAGAGGWAASTTFFFRPRFPFPGMEGAVAASVMIWAPPTSPVATLSGNVSPPGSCTTFAALTLLVLRVFGEGLTATAFCGVTAVVAAAGAGTAIGAAVMKAWLVPGMSWIWPACGTTWMVWAPWICGTTWYWMLAAGTGVLARPGLCWMVRTMGPPPAGAEPRPAGSWITLPLADRKPRFLGGAGAMGAGLMGRSLRGCGCTGGEAAGTWAAGGPILLQVAARRARGDGWASCEESRGGQERKF